LHTVCIQHPLKSDNLEISPFIIRSNIPIKYS